jgi:hypothetical protein
MTGLLDGKKEISDYLKGASDYKLKKLIAAGMPVLIEDGRWLAHIDNIEDFLRAYTRRRANPDAIKEEES